MLRMKQLLLLLMKKDNIQEFDVQEVRDFGQYKNKL